MFSYIKRLLEPPRFIDIWLWFGIIIVSQLLTKYLLLGFVFFFGMNPIGLPLAIIVELTIMIRWLMWITGPGLTTACVAIGAEIAVLSYIFSPQDDMWVTIGVLAAVVSLAVFCEKMKEFPKR